MRAPRRTPWADKQELGELYDLIYAPSADQTSRQRGLARMSIYTSSPSCPAFIHLLQALVASTLGAEAPVGSSDLHAVRLGCAMALVRFVNGMVDPLQTGPYARPVSHLAAQLGIPQSIVALRHRATHEDLPPLPLLLKAVHDCTTYIDHYSFRPLLFFSAAEMDGHPPAETWRGKRRASELVRRWKKTMKIRQRERLVDEEDETAREIRRLGKEMGREELEDVVDVLCEPGGLVPVSRAKRPKAPNTELPSLLRVLWAPLIQLSAGVRPEMMDRLAEQLWQVVATLPPNGVRLESEQIKEAASYRWTMAVWLLYLWKGTDGGLPPINGGTKRALRADILRSLLQADHCLKDLAHSLQSIDGPFERAWKDLRRAVPVADEDGDDLQGLQVDAISADEAARKLNEMEMRLGQLDRQPSTAPNEISMTANPKAHATSDGHTNSEGHTGWHRLDHVQEWRPSPIGVWSAA